MKKRTRCLTGLLAMVCVLSLSACKINGNSTGESSPTQGAEHIHSYDEWTLITAATCTADGLKEGVCACGEKTTQTIPATGHGAAVVRDARDATCTENGYTGDSYCEVCGEKIEAGKEIAATGHSFGQWTVKTAATCTAEGLKERVCACGETETEVIPATGHGATEVRDARDVTCTEKGYTGDTYCTVCGEKIETGEEIVATGHVFGEWTLKTAAGCNTAGLKERVCPCGEKETQTIPATGHIFGSWIVVTQPTGTQYGTSVRCCAFCDGREYQMLPATGNMTLSIELTWEDGEVLAKVLLSGGAGVTNGKVTVTYDADLLSLADIDMVMPCGLYDVNARTAGMLSIAWVGSDSAQTQTLFCLKLTPAEGAQLVHFGVRLDEGYADTCALTAAPVEAELTLDAKGGAAQ